MKKTMRKKILVIITVCMFAVMMGFSVTTSVNGTNFSLMGHCALASGSSGGSCSGNPCSSCSLVDDWNGTGNEGCDCNDWRQGSRCDHKTG